MTVVDTDDAVSDVRRTDADRSPRPRRWVVVVAVVAIVVIVLVSVAVAMVRDDRPSVIPPPAYVIRVVRDGDRVQDDGVLEDALAGTLSVSEDLQMMAFCVNTVDWMIDQTLSLPVIVGTDPALVRAAELAADALGSQADLIAEVETEYWRLNGDLEGLERWRDDITDPVRRQAVSRYLDERGEPPSDAALDRFVVYAASDTTFEQVIMYLDRERVSPGTLAVAGRARIDGEITVAGSGEWRTVDPAGCPDVPLRSGG